MLSAWASGADTAGAADRATADAVAALMGFTAQEVAPDLCFDPTIVLAADAPPAVGPAAVVLPIIPRMPASTRLDDDDRVFLTLPPRPRPTTTVSRERIIYAMVPASVLALKRVDFNAWDRRWNFRESQLTPDERTTLTVVRRRELAKVAARRRRAARPKSAAKNRRHGGAKGGAGKA